MRRQDPELKFHCAIRDYLEVTLRPGGFVFHPANGEKRDKGTAAKLKRMGVKAGVADLVVVARGGRIAFIEVKRPGGRVSHDQDEFRLRCTQWGVPYLVATSIDDVQPFLRLHHIDTREVA